MAKQFEVDLILWAKSAPVESVKLVLGVLNALLADRNRESAPPVKRGPGRPPKVQTTTEG